MQITEPQILQKLVINQAYLSAYVIGTNRNPAHLTLTLTLVDEIASHLDANIREIMNNERKNSSGDPNTSNGDVSAVMSQSH